MQSSGTLMSDRCSNIFLIKQSNHKQFDNEIISPAAILHQSLSNPKAINPQFFMIYWWSCYRNLYNPKAIIHASQNIKSNSITMRCILIINSCSMVSHLLNSSSYRLNSLKYKQMKSKKWCFRKNIMIKLQTHHQAFAINIYYVHQFKCYGSENTHSSEFREVKGNDSFRLKPLLLKLLIASTSAKWWYTYLFSIIFINIYPPLTKLWLLNDQFIKIMTKGQ